MQTPSLLKITLLNVDHCSGEPGLEVCSGKGITPQQAMQSGLWVPCDPVEGAITVNIGDALQYWSDGRLRSTYHRVRMPSREEYQVSPS